jgi:hypothetical protein
LKVSPTKLWALGLTLLGLLVIFATYRDYGISWDEPVQSQFGEDLVRYYASGLEDRRVNEFRHMRFYGPLFELATALLYATNHEAKYEIRHLSIAIMGLLAILGVMRIACQVPGRWAVVYSCLALAMMPRFYGHAFINSKDIPFACCFVWSMAGLIALSREPRSWRRVVFAGVALGLTLSVRPGGLPLLLGLYGCLMAIGLWSRGELGVKDWGRPALLSVAVWLIAWTGMVLLWPWAHEAPIANPIAAIRAALSFPDIFPVLFDGRISMSDALPRSFHAKYLLITTPPVILLLSLIGLGASIRWQRRGRTMPETLLAASLQLWLIAPLAIIALGRPNVYDGIRHILFVLPAVALFAGWGAAWLVDAMPKPEQRTLMAVVLGMALALPVFHLVRLHPYQMTYFNFFVGGLEGAYGRYETDYWLLSYKEAMEWINDRAREHPERGLEVLAAVDDYSYQCAAAFAAPGVSVEKITTAQNDLILPAGYDYSIATTRYGLDSVFPDSPIVHRIERAGAVFSVIRGRERE